MTYIYSVFASGVITVQLHCFYRQSDLNEFQTIRFLIFFFYLLPTLPVSSGTALNKSATKPMSATWKMGASGSLLMATMVFESFMPARC